MPNREERSRRGAWARATLALLGSGLALSLAVVSSCEGDGTGEWSRALPGADDHDVVLKADSCCADDSFCQDGLYCNGHETCNCYGTCERAAGPIVCNDGVSCTIDSCDETTDACRYTMACNDSNLCTRDICNPDGTCSFPRRPLGFPCDDAQFCTMGSTCDGVGVCIGDDVTPCQASPNCPVTSCDDLIDTCGCAWTDDSDYGGGTFTGAALDPSYPLPGYEDCALAGNICLDSTLSPMRHIYVPNSESNTIAKINVDTGAIEPGFPRASLGSKPSRTVVDSRDLSVWLGNRGWEAPSNGELSNVVHFAPDGSVLCRIPLPGMVRALAIDGNHDVWAGLWNDQQIVKISGSLTDAGAPYPRCRELARYSIVGRPYGAAGDAYGNVWFVLNDNWANSFTPSLQALLRVPIADPTLRTTHIPVAAQVGGCFNTYGIAVDRDGRVWIGSYACWTVLRYTPSTNTWNYISVWPWGTPRGVAMDAAGIVYVALSNDAAGNTRRVARIPTDMSTFNIIDLGAAAQHPVGTAIDYRGRVWTVQRTTNNACRIDVSAWPGYSVNCYPTGLTPTDHLDPYAYTDMTGMQHLLFTSPTGTWIVNMDAGNPLATWSRIVWSGREVPGVTDISVRARTASTQAGLATATWSGSYTTSPAGIGLDATMAHTNQWIQVEVTLSTTDPRQTPVLQDIQALWTL